MSRQGTSAPDTDPELQRLLQESRAREALSLHGRELRVELGAAITLLAVAVGMIALLPWHRALEPGLAIGMVIALALSARVEFHVGVGWAVASQLVFVPMLFLLPTPAVPLLVAVALPLARLPEYLAGSIRADRSVAEVANAWYSVGPALVLSAAGAGAPAWADWPIYLAALGSQFGLDLARATIYGRLVVGVRPGGVLREVRSAYLVDALLSPVGLLVAFSSISWSWAFVLVVPLLGLLRAFARERQARIANAQVLSSAYRGTAHLMADLLTTSHEYTGSHSRSVVVLAHQVGAALHLEERVLRDIEFGALLHDIGKMAVPNEIINKPGKLTEEEWAVMRAHTVKGEDMLDRIGGVLAEVGHVVRSHHEHFDGSGYPDGLRAEEIPIAARVIAACDAFSAMTTDRSYRPAMSLDEAVDELRRNAGTQFDPRVVDALVAIVETWEVGRPRSFDRGNGSRAGLEAVA